MKIGIVTTWLERGAGYVSKIYKELLEIEGHEVFIFARGENEVAGNTKGWSGKNVTRFSRYRNTTISKRIFFKWIKDNDIDAILFNEQRDYRIVIETKKCFPNIKIGAYVDYFTEETREWFNLYDFVICNTKRHMEALSQHPQKYYIKWGTDTELYKPKDSENDKITFFHSVGMSDRKGTDILIEAFIEGKCYQDANLVIHTQIPIEKICKYNKEQLEQYNIDIIEKTVTAPGLYYMGDIYVYPTRLDGLGLTMYEALSCGLPVITSDFPPMNEAVNNDIGRLIRIKDYYCRNDAYYYPMVICDKDDLISVMKWYIENPTELIHQKAAARKYALDNYTIKNRSKEVARVFEDAICREVDRSLCKRIKKDMVRNFMPYKWFFSVTLFSRVIQKIKRN